jgi:hypothetical protein
LPLLSVPGAQQPVEQAEAALHRQYWPLAAAAQTLRQFAWLVQVPPPSGEQQGVPLGHWLLSLHSVAHDVAPVLLFTQIAPAAQQVAPHCRAKGQLSSLAHAERTAIAAARLNRPILRHLRESGSRSASAERVKHPLVAQ